MQKKYPISIFLLLFTLLSCEKTEDPIPELVTSPTSNPFQVYVDRFFEEGRKRGFYLDQNNLQVQYMKPNSENQHFCGFAWANYENSGQRRIEISQLPYCWDERSDLEKEGLMFHELGHAVLGRIHINDKLENGVQKSLMCGSPGNCNQFSLYNEFTLKLREYYIDELFNPAAPAPDWAKAKTNIKIFHQDNFENGIQSWNFFEGSIMNEDNFIGSVEDGALKVMSLSDQIKDQFGGWWLQFPNPPLEEGQSLKLTVTLSTRDLVGNGGSLVLRTDSGTEAKTAAFASTQGNTTINGNLEKDTFSTRISYIPADIRKLNVYLLLLANTKGSIYFEDLEVSILE